MLTRKRILSALALTVFVPFAAQAAPVKYDLVFEGTEPGVGSFLWDADTTSFSSFIWDFGDGLTGGLRDSIDWTEPTIGNTTNGGYLFEVLTGTDYISGGQCGTSLSCSAAFQSDELFGFPSTLASFSHHVGVEGPRYFLLGANSVIRSGRIIATPSLTDPVPVPEPPTLALLLLGVAGLVLRRRRRTAS